MDSPGLEGWWICGFNGKQGICPQNRLRLLAESEQVALRESKRRSWQNFLSKTNAAGAVSKTPEPGIVYDSPSQRHVLQVAQGQYDVPSAAQTVQADESYDVPKPSIVRTPMPQPSGALSLTPSSSISSLTTDSNRSSLIQQDYDVPRAAGRPGQAAQGHYDVPKGGEVTLDMTSALEWLGRLEADVTGSISRLLALATAGWRTKAKLEPRIGELKGSVVRLGSSLHDLTVFSHAVLASHHETGLGQKLSPLVAALNKADLQVKDCLNQLDAIGWSVIVLTMDDTSSNKDSDVLDKLVQTAAALTDDIRAIASFIQGNSTLLFKRTSGLVQTPDDGQYMNLSGRSGVASNSEDYVKPPNRNGTAAGSVDVTPPRQLSETDRKTLELYAGHYWQQASLLDQAIESFLATITNNQPPKTFLSQCKLVVLAAHNMIAVGEIIERAVEDEKIRTVAGCCNRLTLEAVGSLVARTAAAAAHFPSVRAVQKMVDAVVGLTNPPQRLSHTLHAVSTVSVS